MELDSAIERAATPGESLFATFRAVLFPTRASTEDEAAFRAFELDENVANWRSLVLAVSVFAILWWPTDLLFFGDRPEVRQAFGLARAVSSETGLVVWLIVGRVPMDRRYALLLLGFVGVVTSFVCGYELGGLGGPRELWFNFLYGLVLTPLAISVPLRQRVAWTALFGTTIVVSFFGLHPENARDLYAGSVLSYLVFVGLMGIWCGLLLDRLRRRNYFLRKQSERDAAALAELNRHLNARVDEQTDELRRLTQSIETARETERARIARELHDELGQELTALRYELKVARITYERDPSAIAPALGELEQLVSRTTRTTRRVVTALRPKVLDDLGLFAAAEYLARESEERAGLPCRLSLPETEVALPPEVASTAFRVLQESLTNAAKHAAATAVEIALEQEGGTLVVSVRDDGAGFVPGTRASGVGLIGMRERVRHAGGQLEVRSAPGEGTIVRARLPVGARAREAS